tara:strand:- start:3349 stop:4512 length:1164 start_codon:yes stop_codon:yes gene_type:complete
MVRKVCIITATRAEFGPLKCLIEGVIKDPDLELQLIVTGAHLSPEFGNTVEQIVESNIPISKRIEILLSSDSAIGVGKTMGLALISFSEAFQELNPDLIIVLGDRYELIPIVSAANIAQIPVAHISGGEVTEGAIDDLIRHSVTKMSQLHFTAMKEYSKRVIQMGEQPSRVFTVGEPGLDNLNKMNLLTRDSFQDSINCKLHKKNLLITYHPVTTETIENVKVSFQEILSSLDELKDTLLIFTKANADVGGRIINQMIDDYVFVSPDKAIAFNSLGQLRYLSALKYVDAVVGNSSSGICEAPSLKVATINIGNRQKGRIKAASTIDVETNKKDIMNAIEYIYSPEFRIILCSVNNPYGDGYTTQRIIDIIKKVNIDELKCKQFYDIK